MNLSILLVASAVLLIMLPFIIPLLYTSRFRSSILPAEILIVATLLLGIGMVLGAGLRGMGRPEEVSKAEALAFGVTFVGLMVLLPRLGIVGAALTSLAAYGTSVTFLAWRLDRTGKVRLADLFRPMNVTVAWLRLRQILRLSG